MEPCWHTTRVRPGALRRRADRSERAFGTLPPAAGLIDLSGAGSGQYDGRSTCADADPVTASATATRTAKAKRLIGGVYEPPRGRCAGPRAIWIYAASAA